MNKELKISYTPLQCLNNIRDNYFHNKGGTDLEYTWFNIIETAIKNYEKGLYHAKTYVKHTSKQALYDLLGLAIKNVHESFWELPEQLFNDVIISLNALDIIKEKFRILEPIGFDVKNNRVAFGCLIQKKELTVVEYKLLKEVLK